MGAVVSKQNKYFLREVLPGVQETLDMLQVDVVQGQKYYNLFMQIDVKGKQELELSEFYGFFGVKKSKFTDRMFLQFDFDHSGEIDFNEFLIGLWNFCTFSNKRMLQFGYSLFDIKERGGLDKFELDAMFRMIHDVEALSSDLQEAIKGAKESKKEPTVGLVKLGTCNKLCQSHPELLKPAVQVRERVQKLSFGIEFWENETARRTHDFGPLELIENILLRRRKQVREQKKKEAEERLKQKFATLEEVKRLEEEQKRREEEEKRLEEEERLKEFEANELKELETKKALDVALSAFKECPDTNPRQKAELKEELSSILQVHRNTATGAIKCRELRAYRKCMEEAEIKAEEFFSTKHGKKFLKLITKEMTARQFDTRFGYHTKRQLQYGMKKARAEYLAKKTKDKNAAIKQQHDEERKEMNDAMELILKENQVLTAEQDKYSMWQWQRLIDPETLDPVYFCPANGLTLHEAPFLKNHLGVCMDPTCKVGAVLRCIECDKEYCRDCHLIAHSVGGARFHGEPSLVPFEENEWRKGLKALNRRTGMPKQHRQFVEYVLMNEVEVERRKLVKEREDERKAKIQEKLANKKTRSTFAQSIPSGPNGTNS